MEVYLDDLLIKRKKLEQHIKDLRDAFTVLRKYQMKLKSLKCAFEVESRRFLGFVVLE